MKSKVTFAAIALCFAVSSQSFGFDLLDRMLGGNSVGCDTSCCATPEPSCGCDGIGMIRGRFFNRGCGVNACDTGCATAGACDTGCGMNAGCRPRLLSFDVRCISIPVIVPKITLPKIRFERCCPTACCDNGCDTGAGCRVAEPACGADNACDTACCKPVISIKLNRCGLLDRMRCRPRLFNRCGCATACDSACNKANCGCEPACGSDYSAPANKSNEDAPKPEPAKEVTSNRPVPPAPVVDPSAFGGIRATPISDIN